METEVVEGYILDSTPYEVELQYDGDAPEVVVYELNVTNRPTEMKLPQTGDNMKVWWFVGTGVGIILIGILTVLNRKN